MTDFLGAVIGLGQYFLVLLVYAGLFVVMRYARPTVEPEFRKTFIILYIVYAIAIFIANYLLYRVGVMSFLPWLNNFFHTVIWIGLCLTFLYAGSYNRPLWVQFVMFAIFSFPFILKNYEASSKDIKIRLALQIVVSESKIPATRRSFEVLIEREKRTPGCRRNSFAKPFPMTTSPLSRTIPPWARWIDLGMFSGRIPTIVAKRLVK